MKKSYIRITVGVIVIAAVVMISVGATLAYFNDQGVIFGNHVSTGEIDLTLTHSTGKPFYLNGICPGYVSSWQFADLKNSGSIPLEAYAWAQKTGGSIALYNYLRIEMTDSGADRICGNGDDTPIYNGPLYAINQAGRVKTSDKFFAAVGTPGNDNIIPWNIQRVCQRISLPGTAGNEVKNQWVEFTEYFDAEQGECCSSGTCAVI